MSEWKPAGYPSVSPYLIAADAQALIAFIEAAFEGVLLRRFDRPDGSLMHAEVRIDDSVVMIGGGATDVQAAVHIHVYVADVHSTFERALLRAEKWSSSLSVSVPMTTCAAASAMRRERHGGSPHNETSPH